MSPGYKALQESMYEVIKNQPDYISNTRNKPEFEKMGILKSIAQGTIAVVKNSIEDHLVLSLTSEENNQKMWASYADDLRGIVLGFDESNKFFSEKTQLGMLPVERVLYSSSRPECFGVDELFTDPLPVETLKMILLTKHTDWEMEKEYRMLASKEHSVIAGTASDVIYLRNFPKESLISVVFGSRCRREDLNEITSIVTREYSSTKLLKARPKTYGYGFDYLSL